jgi:outer membrane biosynthesis protein TonB
MGTNPQGIFFGGLAYTWVEMRPSTLTSVLLATAVLLGSLQGAARAASDRPRVSVLPVGGSGGPDVQKAVTKVVGKHGFQLVSPQEFRATTNRVAANLEGAEAIKAVATDLALVAVVMGKVTVVKKKFTVQLMVRDGRDGEVIGDATFASSSKRRLAKVVEKTFWKKLGKSFRTTPAGVSSKPIDSGEDPFAQGKTPAPARTPASAAPAPEPEPAPAPAAEAPQEEAPPPVVARKRAPPAAAAEQEEEAEAPSKGPQPAQFEIVVSPRMTYRNFTYTSDPQDALSEYHTSAPGPAINIALSGFFRMVFPRVGLMASFEQGQPLPATTSGGLEYRTFSGDYFATLLMGVPTKHLVADLAVGGGRQRYAFSASGDSESRPRPVPNVTYDYLRVGLDLHVYTGTPFGIFGGGYYRYVLASGLISSPDWFPSARAWGAEGNLGVSYRILSWLEARAQADVRMYTFRMDPDAGDAHVTDGARDLYWGGSLSLAVLLGGKS